MLIAIPAVNPVITGWGMYFMSVPRRSAPAAISIRPASSVQRTSPPNPNRVMTPNTTGINAAVGPPI